MIYNESLYVLQLLSRYFYAGCSLPPLRGEHVIQFSREKVILEANKVDGVGGTNCRPEVSTEEEWK